MVTRRTFLTSTGLAATGVAGAAISEQTFALRHPEGETAIGSTTISAYGKHQPGVELELQSFGRFVSLDIHEGVDRAAMLRWMSLLTDDIVRLTSGTGALADPTPQLANFPARLTVTVGFGPSLFSKLGLESQLPLGFGALPSFQIDDLNSEHSDGDVLLHFGADDSLTLAHATRTLLRDSADFASVRWVHEGFTNAQGVQERSVTQRNLMGQVDGTDNPKLASADFESLVWMHDGPSWCVGGTNIVIRKIRMNLDTWDQLSTSDREGVIGRRLSDGAPLGGESEFDAPDLMAEDKRGLKVIPEFAHIRRAAGETMEQRFFRRPLNYELTVDGAIESGLLWVAYARNLETQYVPVQQRLASFDLLNKWTTPVASAVFTIAPGFGETGIIAEQLFS